jgi:hypothetical protein
MNIDLVFLVHGMGEYEATASPAWVASWTKAIDAEAKRYPYFAGSSFSKEVKIIPVTYADIFVDYWNTLSPTTQKIKDAVKKNPGGHLKNADWEKIVSYIPDQAAVTGDPKKGTQGKFFWTHVCDVLLYLAGLDILVNAKVAKIIEDTLVQELKAAEDSGNTISVHFVCHSLGTRVVYDTLRRLATDPKTKVSKPGILTIESHHAVANVSRLMQLRGGSVYQPPMVVSQSSLSTAFFKKSAHYYHFVDPFTLLRRYDVRQARLPGEYNPTSSMRQVELTRYMNGLSSLKEVHDFETYIKDPRVHVPLLRAIVSENVISDAEEAKAIAAFDGDTTDIVNQIPPWARHLFPASPIDQSDDGKVLAELVRIMA